MVSRRDPDIGAERTGGPGLPRDGPGCADLYPAHTVLETLRTITTGGRKMIEVDVFELVCLVVVAFLGGIIAGHGIWSNWK